MKVSVIIPTYNRAVLVQHAIASVLDQTYPPYEVIVIDDGSSDDTMQKLAPLQATGEITVLRTEHTGMPGTARNRGTEHARGDMIAFLDSDDLWYPEKLERQMEIWAAADRRRGDGAQTGINAHPVLIHTRELWNRNGQEISQAAQQHLSEGWIFPDALKKCIIGPSTVMLRRDVLEEAGGFREDLPVAEDYELWLHVTARYPVMYVDAPLIEKRAGHGAQLSERWGVIEYFRLRALLDFLGHHVEIPAPPGLPALCQNASRSAESMGTELTIQQRAAARLVLEKKLKVFVRGAAKRGNVAIVDWYKSQIGG